MKSPSETEAQKLKNAKISKGRIDQIARKEHLPRRHKGGDWAAISNTYPPKAVLSACAALERLYAGKGERSGRAKTRMNARALAAMVEFTDLSVTDAGAAVGLTVPNTWSLRQRWTLTTSEQRAVWLDEVERVLKATKAGGG